MTPKKTISWHFKRMAKMIQSRKLQNSAASLLVWVWDSSLFFLRQRNLGLRRSNFSSPAPGSSCLQLLQLPATFLFLYILSLRFSRLSFVQKVLSSSCLTLDCISVTCLGRMMPVQFYLAERKHHCWPKIITSLLLALASISPIEV